MFDIELDEAYDWQDDDADLRNYCPLCGHNYLNSSDHNDDLCAKSQE